MLPLKWTLFVKDMTFINSGWKIEWNSHRHDKKNTYEWKLSVDLASISRSNVVSDERFSVLFAVAAHAACLKFERHPAGVVLLCLAEITGRCLGQIDNLGYSRFLMTLHVILFPCAAAFAFIRTSAITYSTYCCLLLKKMVVAPYWWYRSRLGWHIAFSEI